MSSKEPRSVAQVRRLFSALGRPDAQIQPQAPPRPDVLVEIDKKRIAVEATDYHSDEANHGGSTLRKQEEQHAAAGQMIMGSCVPLDPTPVLVRRINEKVSNSYELTGTDEFWLAIFACVPQVGAVVSTFLFPMALDCQKLTTLTASLLENSHFVQAHIFCELAVDGQRLYSWQKGAHWREATLPGRRTDSEPSLTFWDIQKLFKKS